MDDPKWGREFASFLADDRHLCRQRPWLLSGHRPCYHAWSAHIDWRIMVRPWDTPFGLQPDSTRRFYEEEQRFRKQMLEMGSSGAVAEFVKMASEQHRLQRAIEDAVGGSAQLHRILEQARERHRLHSELVSADQFAAIRDGLNFRAQLAPAFHQRIAGIAEMAQRSLGSFGSLGAGSIQETLVELQRNLSFDHGRLATLASQLGQVDRPWAYLSDRAGSVAAFMELDAFSSTVRSLPSFGTEHGALISTELGTFDEGFVEAETTEDEAGGEQVYTEHGRNPALIAFPTESYPTVLQAAGWTELHLPAPLPRAEDGSVVEGYSYDPAEQALVTAVEAHLREFVDVRMRARFGSDWLVQHVHPDRRAEWSGRRDASVARGFPQLGLIYYADFSELKDLIGKKQPWNEIFRDAFKVPEVFATSMIRMHGIRIELSHARVLTKTARLVLEVEANAIFRAIGAIKST